MADLGCVQPGSPVASQPTACAECGEQIPEYAIDRGWEHCPRCIGQDEDMTAGRMGR